MQKFNVLEWLYEYWAPANGFDGYEVSNWGKLRSIDRVIKREYRGDMHIKGQLLKPHIDRNGYVRYEPHSDKSNKKVLIHQIVLKTFSNNPYNYTEINHKDENKSNNSVWNLEYCNRAYNINYGKWKEKQSNRPDIAAKKRAIIQLKNGKIVNEYDSACAAARAMNTKPQHIHRVLLNKRKTHKGYEWKYKEN